MKQTKQTEKIEKKTKYRQKTELTVGVTQYHTDTDTENPIYLCN